MSYLWFALWGDIVSIRHITISYLDWLTLSLLTMAILGSRIQSQLNLLTIESQDVNKCIPCELVRHCCWGARASFKR